MATPILAALWSVGALRGGMEHSGVVRGILFPDQGSNPGSLHWECEVIATGPPGKSCKHFLKESTFISSLRDISQSPRANEQLSKYSLCTQASLVAQLVKNPPVMQETWVRSLGWEDPLEKGKAAHSSILAWRIPWTEEPGGLQPVGSQRIRHD